MKLIIVRHGQCVANVEGIVAGSSIDSPLTDQGIKEAGTAAARLARQPIGRIISSPLVRALRTAEIIRDRITPALEIEIDPAFTERDSGVANGTDRNQYLADLKAGLHIPGAESPEEILNRVKSALDKLSAGPGPVLIATHEGTARAIECVVTRRPASDFGVIAGLANGEIRELEFI